MMNLKREDIKDNSSIIINYKEFKHGIWVYHSIQCKSEDEAKTFLNEIKKDFKRRLIDVEKRTIIYERFVHK
jgi:hypothetical protein